MVPNHGVTSEHPKFCPVAEKIKSFGSRLQVDGHNILDIEKFNSRKTKKPLLLYYGQGFFLWKISLYGRSVNDKTI